jgi:endonuclease/exonuclease/phosphatase family metal-dependent hydrolase
MPTPLLEKPEADRDEGVNPGDEHFDDIINRNFNASEQERLGKEASAMDTMGGSADSLADGVRDLEGSPSGGWATNVTGAEAAPASFAAKATDLAKKAQLVLKKRGAIIGLVTLLGGGAAIPFLGATSLPFSILGNMDMKSLMHGLQQYSEDFYGYKIFGGKKTTVDSNGDKLRGLRDTEIEQLKKQGVTLYPEGGKKTKSGKYVFEAVQFKDGPKVSASQFRTELIRNPAFRRAMVIDKGSYFKSAKSAAAKKVWGLFKYPVTPDLKGDTPEEKDKKLYAAAMEETSTNFAAGIDEEKDKDGKVTNADEQQKARETIGEMQSEVDRVKTEIADGKISQDVVNKSNMGNLGYLMAQEGVDVTTATKSLGGQIWGFVNSLDVFDTVCTIYQVAQQANALARTVALVNTVRFAMTIRSALERAKAGEDDGSVNYLMNLLMQKDPITGQSFDSSSYAAMLFNGQLSSEPSAVSATGGRAMVALYTGMLALHSSVGQLFDWGTPGNMSAYEKARFGRKVMKTGCQIATNLGVQIGVTVASFVVGFFTGGASKAAETAVKAGISTAIKITLKEVISQMRTKMVEKFGKQAIEKLLKDKLGQFAEKGLFRTMAKDSWKAFKTINKSFSGWDKLGILLAAVSTFGMGYIVQVLAGGNIAGFIKNGFAAFDGLGTGWQMYEFSNGIGSGGNAATYAQMTAYEDTLKQYQNSYIEDQKYLAKDTPLDITNPYSTLGLAAGSVQRTMGAASFKDPLAFFTSLATLPFRSPTSSIASAIGEPPTPEQIGEEVGNEFFSDNKIALQAMGSPSIVFQKKYTFEDIMEKLVDSESPQIRYDGDSTTGEPKMAIIENSELAQYKEKCHNPGRTELDPQYAVDDEESNIYDIETCVAGGPKYDKEKYPLYDDAIRFVNQVNPSEMLGQENATGGGEFTIASYNILGEDNHAAQGKDISGCTAATGSAECLKLRSDYQLQIIKGQAGNPAFDIFGTQETSPKQYDYYKTNLSGYSVFPEDTSRMTQQEDGRTAIWWNSSKFTKVASGKAPGVSNVVKGSLPNVTVPWVELQDAKGNKVFVMSIHYPITELGGTADVIKKASQYTVDWAKTKVSATTPVVVVGDFNDKPEQKLSYCTYTKGGIMQHAKDMQDGAPNKECPNPDKINGIDHIYVSTEGGLTASNWTHMAKEGVVAKGSDHQPVYVKLSYPGSQTAGGVAWVLDRKYYDDPATHAGFMKGHGYSGGSFYGADNSVDISFGGILGLPVYALVGGNVTKRPLPRSSQACVGTPNPSNNGGLEITSKVPGGTLRVSYAHGNDVTTKSTVNTGEQIMTVGNVGNSCGAHLHMDIDYNGKPICPNDVFLDLAANKNIDYNDLAGRATAQCTGRG